jgi:hypothetical protein
VFLSASAQGGRERNEAAYGLWITTPDMKPISLASSVQGWQAVALLQAMLEAVLMYRRGVTLHVVSELKQPFTDLLNEDRSVRRSRNYQKTNGKPLANKRERRALDASFDRLNLTICAGAPRTAVGKAMFDYLAKLVRDARANIDNPDEWPE